jgi:hypothetical protein
VGADPFVDPVDNGIFSTHSNDTCLSSLSLSLCLARLVSLSLSDAMRFRELPFFHSRLNVLTVMVCVWPLFLAMLLSTKESVPPPILCLYKLMYLLSKKERVTNKLTGETKFAWQNNIWWGWNRILYLSSSTAISATVVDNDAMMSAHVNEISFKNQKFFDFYCISD